MEYIADVINDNTLKNSADRIWEATVEIQYIRNKFIEGFHKIAIENENLKQRAGKISEEKILEILQEQDIPEFFKNLYINFEVFYAVEIKKIILNRKITPFKRINLTELGLDDKIGHLNNTKSESRPANNDIPNNTTNQYDNQENTFTSKKYQETIPPWMLIHLSSKAKSYNLSTPKRRHVLYEMAKMKGGSINLSEKQSDYLEDIIKELIDSEILTKKCKDDTCGVCKEISDILIKNRLLNR